MQPQKRQHADFNFRFRPFGTDEFAADLTELTLGALLATLCAQHVIGVRKTQRPWRAGQPRRRNPCNLRRDVGTHAQHPVRNRVHQAEGFMRERSAGTGREKTVLEFGQRRLDALIAKGCEMLHKDGDGPRFLPGFGRQKVDKAARQ